MATLDAYAYTVLLMQLDLPAQDVIFIDDLAENIEAAKEIGLDTILFRSEQELRKELIQRGLLE